MERQRRRQRKKGQMKKKLNNKMRTKLVLLFVIIVVALLVLNIRISYINMKSGAQYTVQVLAQQRYESRTLPYQRGNITDRNGIVLASSEKVYNLILDAKIMNSEDGKYLNTTLTALQGCFGYDISEISRIVSEEPERQYYVYQKGLSYDEIEQFQNLMNGNTKELPEWFGENRVSDIQGVWFEEEYKRTYPYNTLACDLLGYTNSGNVGSWGIEQQYNDILNGTNGRTYGYLNQDSALERVIKPATDGNTVVTTIDMNLQRIVENHIQSFCDTTGAKDVAVMIMDPNNGEILAMASAPVFDLNQPRDLTAYFTEEELAAMTEEERSNFLYSLWKNYCISETYEPGSTAKPFTVAAGMEEGYLHGTETYDCIGYRWAGGHQIFCHTRAGDGLVTLEESIKYSCNVAMMDIAAQMGKTNFVKYHNIFGFYSRTGIDLPGEEIGLHYTAETMDESSLATNSFGQNFNITMVQMAAAFSSLINGGYYYEPHVMRKIQEPSGATVETAEPVLVKQTVGKDTSALLREYLYETVEGGTGSRARVEGYKIGGKTGTAEKHPREEKKYVVSFISFAPVDDPQFVLYVVIDEPNLENQADASITTIMTRGLMEEILPYMGVFPDIEEEPDTVPEETSVSGETETTTEEETQETNEDGEPIRKASPVYDEIITDGGFMGEDGTSGQGETTGAEGTTAPEQ